MNINVTLLWTYAIKSAFDKPDIWSAEIFSLWPSTAEIKSAEINSVNSVSKLQKFISAEITRYTVVYLNVT